MPGGTVPVPSWKEQDDRGKSKTTVERMYWMRMKLLRGDDDATVLLVYPATIDEYTQALDAVGRAAGAAGVGQAAGEPARRCCVVTTAEQRARWDLPDLAASGRARVVDPAQAFGLLLDGAGRPEAAHQPPAGPAAAAPPRRDGGSGGPALDAVRALVTPGARLDQVLATLDAAGLPGPVRQKLRRNVRQALAAEAEAVDEALDQAETVLSLPWRTREPQRFDPEHLKQVLDRTHGGLEPVKTRIIEVLAACPQARGLLTVETPRRGRTAETDPPPALAVRPRPSEVPGSVLCLAGQAGTGKRSLALAIARALGRTHVRVTLGDHNAEGLLQGVEGDAAGRIVKGLREAGVNNPVFILEAIDQVEQEAAEALLGVLDPVRRTAFRDAYVDVAFDLSAVLWIVTATDPGAIPEPVRKHLAVVELPGYTEQEKLAIAERHLLTRPFDEPARMAAGWLEPELPALSAMGEPAAATGMPAVVVERELLSVQELERWSAGTPPPGAGEAWRTAASAGGVRFETEAILRVIRDHTREAGVAELNRKLAAICHHVVSRRPPGDRGPEVITEATVRDVLGVGAADALPPAVQAAIARERRRLSANADAAAAPSNDWIEWLEHLPWNRRSEAPADLAQARAGLDARHAGLDHAKARIVEYLAVRRRNRRGPGAVICFSGPSGVGKTSLAQCVAEALGRGFVKLACGGLRDETDLRGHNRTWKGAQPGSILRELRRVGAKDPVFVLDEIDKLGPDPAAVLLEVLDPAQHHRFRDAFVELPFDLSEVLFITTANEPARIPPALRDRLEFIDLPGYTETEKVAIAQTHLIDAQNRAAGLTAAPVRFTAGACRRIIRDYTSERGIRQLARCLQTVCRKVALGLETGDASLVRDRITARQVRKFLGEPDEGPHRPARPPAPTARRAGAAACRAGPGAAGPRTDVGVGAQRSRARPCRRVPAMSGEPALDRAQRAARFGARSGGPRRGACGARRSEGAPHRLRRRAPGEPGRPVSGAVAGGRARSRQIDAGAPARGRAGAGVRLAALRRTGLGGGAARRPLGSARTHCRGAAARRRPQSGVRPRRGRPPRRNRWRRRGAARGARPGPRRGLPRPLSRRGLRPVRSALRGDARPAPAGCRPCCASG